MSYQPGVPTGSIPLNVDYKNLQQNFTQINNQWLVDHVPLTSTSGVPPNGYHTSVHLNPISTTGTNPPTNYPPALPPNTSGICQLFSAQTNDGINTDQTLYFLTGLNRLMQLTRNFTPTVGANGSFPSNGYTFIPGGFILQWGSVAATSSNPTVTFTAAGGIAFSSAIYNVQVTRQHSSASPGSTFGYWVNTSGISTTGFQIINNDGHTWSYNWWAIGA